MINTENFTFRESFNDLQVGDFFFLFEYGNWRKIKITRITPKYFFRGYGKDLGNGRFEYENAYRRDNGTKVGGWRGDPNATLPTPELVARIDSEQKEKQDINEFNTLIENNTLPIEKIREILVILKK
jgi:hypothetical protein